MRGAKTRWRLVTGAYALLAFVALATVVPARPAAAVEITTPYPGIAVEPGQDVTFDLNVRAPSQELVQLRVTEVPRGWRAFLQGGGHRILAVYASSRSPEIDLQVQVPENARQGTYRVAVTGRAPSGTDTLALELRVVAQAPGAYQLEVEFPQLRGGTSDTFRFDATLRNNTAQQARFALAAAGPEGWTVEARASAQEQAATVTVEPGSQATIQVEADPPENVQAGTYPVTLRATGEGTTLEQELTVEIAGTPTIEFQTADERLNVSGSAGDATVLQVVVRNTGSGPLEGVQLSASPPSGWEVTFEPSTIEAVPPGQEARATVRITPSGEAIAGDYSVTLNANAENASGSIDLRFAVRTSQWWGLVGVLIIAAAIGALAWTFRRFGRR